MRKPLLCLAAVACAGVALAKLPPPDPAAKATAAETAAKAAWQAKVDAFQLCKTQDRIAAKYGKHDGAQKTLAAAKPAASAATPAASSASAAASSAGAEAKPTPAVASAPPPCADPGPFAYNPPQQTPLETSEAHSPAGNASSPPSARPESGAIQPSGKSGNK